MRLATRREFFGEIGHGMLLASLGSSVAAGLGAALPAASSRLPHRPHDALETLIRRMQESAPDDLLPHLAGELRGGTKLATLVTAGALANARTFGGGDYEGYHAFMALLPAYAMSQQMPKGLEPLPVLKVLYRNTARIRAAGGGRERLEPVEPAPATPAGNDASVLRARVRARDLAAAEGHFAWLCKQDGAHLREELEPLVEDDLNVHRIVLAWRAGDMLQLAGPAHAHPLLRQVVRFCVDEERERERRSLPAPAVRADVPAILDRHELLAKSPGERVPDDRWLEELATLVFGAGRAAAAEAVAAALAEGIAPDAVAEAIVLGANRLLLHDTGARRVHGASVGVHACDAANAWRNVARAGSARTRMTSLVVGAYHTAGQSEQVGREPYAFAEQAAKLTTKDPAELLRAAAAAIEARDQRAACAAVQRYGEQGHDPEAAFALLLRYAVSEDGALHAEKYFHTAREEFARARAAFRWNHVVALARVTASEFGEPAPGVAQAKKLLEA